MYVVIPAIDRQLNNKPAINFDGGDSFWTAQKFNTILNKGYTIFTIARYTGGDNERVFTTRDGRNWLFGFHGNTVRRWYSDGWVHNQGGADTSWHMHIGDMGASGVGDPEANFWLDGVNSEQRARVLIIVIHIPLTSKSVVIVVTTNTPSVKF